MSQTTLDSIEDAHRLELLINSIVDYAIFMLDTEGVVRSWNSGAARLKGYSAKEIIGRSFSVFYTPEDREKGAPRKRWQRREKLDG
jgi:PAS domain S-box-containing protein